jgi:hypothetical protein
VTSTRPLLIRCKAIFGGALVSGAVLFGCVLPDRDIQIVDENIQNKHAVRFVEPTPLSLEALDACEEELGNKTSLCQPGEPEDVLPHYLDPTYRDPTNNDALIYNFCSCDLAAGEESNVELNAFTLYVEDRLDDKSPSPSKLYAAALLDPLPDSIYPQDSVRYRDYLDPLRPLDLDDQLAYEPSKRPLPLLHALNFGYGERIDLCNRADNNPLKLGYHELRIIVTDRPWFQATPKALEDEAGIPQAGVPDIAGGATFDTISYIFRCDDKTVPHCLTDCSVPTEEQ